MKKPTLRWVGIQLGLWVYVGSAAVGLIFLLKEDRASAVIAGLVFAGVILFSKYVLGFGFLSAPMLYFAGLGLFHLGLVVPWALGLYDTSEVWWFRREELTPAVGLVTVALVSLQLGIITAARHRPLNNTLHRFGDQVFLTDQLLFRVGVALLLLGAASYFVGLYGVFGTGFWRIAYREVPLLLVTRDARPYYAGLLLVPIGAYLATAGASRRQLRLVLGLVGVWAACQLFFGLRNAAIVPALVVVYLLHKKGIRFSRSLQYLLLAAVFLAIPAIRAVREEVASQRASALFSAKLNPVGGIAEMGQSIWPVVATYRLTDSKEFRLGRTYVKALRRVVPYSVMGYDPISGQSQLTLEDFPTYWLVATTEPWSLRRNMSAAFSWVAEAYINFGVAGVFLMFFALGYLLTRLEQMPARSPYLLAAQAVVLAPLLWCVRSDFNTFVRPAAWGLACVGVVWWLSSRLKKVRGRTSGMEGVTPSLVAGSPQHSRSARGPAGVASGGGLCTRR